MNALYCKKPPFWHWQHERLFPLRLFTIASNTARPKDILTHCPLSCLTLKVHEFLIINMETVGLLHWPSAIFSAQLSQRGRKVERLEGSNMTLMCQAQRPRLAQRLSILHQDQHFWNSTEPPHLNLRSRWWRAVPRSLFTSTSVCLPLMWCGSSQVSLSRTVRVFQAGHDKPVNLRFIGNRI